jgi:peptidoglycan/LPS O-acetylase OafA/YrhL
VESKEVQRVSALRAFPTRHLGDELPSNNNFDLVRLLASLQVAVVHALDWFHLDSGYEWLRHLLYPFPGVPIFFFVSGLLIARAYDQTGPAQYFRNRCLRIFPALWICLVFTLIVIFANPLCSAPSSTLDWVSWWFAHMSFAQSWAPDFLAGCWHSAFNGGRWTIAVELQFYLLLPLIAMAVRGRGRGGDVLLISLLVASVLCRLSVIDPHESLVSGSLRTFFRLSVVANLWVFVLGILAYRHYGAARRWFEGKLAWWLVAYMATILLARASGLRIGAIDINPISMLVLAGLVLSFAVSLRGLSDRLLRRNDFTYGLYLLHPPALILATTVGMPASGGTAFLAVATGALLAVASWFFVERPFLRHKRTSADSRGGLVPIRR